MSGRLLTLLVVVSAACGDRSSATHARPTPTASQTIATADARAHVWELPAGWRGETIPFPLEFAPSIAHTGVEELRFPPGFFDPASPAYWSYAFVWRTNDDAVLGATALADELTRYFRGLITAVDATKKQVKDISRVTATARSRGARFELTAEVFDAFGKGQTVSLVGWAQRHDCADGALWVFVLAPRTSTIRPQLDDLAASAAHLCAP